MAKVIDITPVLDTGIYADGDVLFQPVEVPLPIGAGESVLLQSVGAIDESDQGAAFDLVFFRTQVTMGTINVAPTISDADARNYCGRAQIAAADYYDLGGNRVVDANNIGRLMKCAQGQTSLWVAGISRGTGTYAADALKLRLGFIT